jgi:hypothetical protein
MTGIERIAMYVTALDDEVPTQLLATRFSVVARGAHRHQPIKGWVSLTARCLHSDDVIDRYCRLDPLLFEAWLAERIHLELHPP